MDPRLSGKVAVVTGSSAGIGLACAKTLHTEGVHIVTAAREARTSIDTSGVPRLKA